MKNQAFGDLELAQIKAPLKKVDFGDQQKQTIDPATFRGRLESENF